MKARNGKACSRRRITAVAVLSLVSALPVLSQVPKHPLDGLTASEIWTTYEVLHSSQKVDDETRYAIVQLHEPPKQEVLTWKPGQAMRREAFAVLNQGARTFEAVVDLNGKRIVSWTEVKGVQPSSPLEEGDEIDGMVKDNPEVKAALKRRGITDLNTVLCTGSHFADYFGVDEAPGHRLFSVECAQVNGPLEDGGMIENLTILWDATTDKALRVTDGEIVPRTKD